MIKKIITSSVLMPLLSVGLYATPALADDVLNISVINNNDAYVTNYVDVTAKTGGNNADGGTGSAAGDGGDIYNGNSGDDVEDSSTGNGGNGGNGGAGGLIVTGGAVATSYLTNDVNFNKTKIDVPCDCNDFGNVNITVNNYNDAHVTNHVDVKAKTGHNDANGGDSGCGCDGGGNGGDINNNGDDVQNSHTGSGGNAGAGGAGGTIITGVADSLSSVVNLVNHNITRIRR